MRTAAIAGRDGPPSAARPIRVMIVDDSAVVRGLVRRWLGAEAGIEVVSMQRTGKAAVEAVEAAAPDVVVLDIEMPEMDGLTALPLLVKKKPGLVVIMASTLTRRNAEVSLKALSLGARDYLAKPDSAHGLVSTEDFRRDLVSKIRALAPRAAAARRQAPAAAAGGHPFALRPPSRTRPRVIAIGASTGGPPALATVLKAIGSAAARVPVVVTQHMPPTFTGILAEHLGRVSGLPAAEGRDGEPLGPGRIYVAPGGRHMTVEGAATPRVRITDDPPVNYCRPAVDPLFSSIADVFGVGALALVLTGMGQDGAAGAGRIVAAGGTVLAQDEASSIVWGMPGAAAKAGHCAAVLPLESIGQKITEFINGSA